MDYPLYESAQVQKKPSLPKAWSEYRIPAFLSFTTKSEVRLRDFLVETIHLVWLEGRSWGGSLTWSKWVSRNFHPGSKVQSEQSHLITRLWGGAVGRGGHLYITCYVTGALSGHMVWKLCARQEGRNLNLSFSSHAWHGLSALCCVQGTAASIP